MCERLLLSHQWQGQSPPCQVLYLTCCSLIPAALAVAVYSWLKLVLLICKRMHLYYLELTLSSCLGCFCLVAQAHDLCDQMLLHG